MIVLVLCKLSWVALQGVCECEMRILYMLPHSLTLAFLGGVAENFCGTLRAAIFPVSFVFNREFTVCLTD